MAVTKQPHASYRRGAPLGMVLTGISKLFTFPLIYFYACIFSMFFCTSCFLVLMAALKRIRKMNEMFEIQFQNSIQAYKIGNEISKVFIAFTKSIDLINKCLWFNFTLRIFEFVFHCVFVVFNAFTVISNDNSWSSIAFFCSGCLYTLLEASFILPLVIFSGHIGGEVSKFISSFYKLNCHLTANFEQTKFSKLRFESIENEVSSGLFNLNWNFLFSIMSTIFSWSIIFVQFDISQIFNKY